jgi:hypothetical protein
VIIETEDSSDDEIKKIAWGPPTSTDTRSGGSGSHPTPKLKAKGKGPVQDTHDPIPKLKAKGNTPKLKAKGKGLAQDVRKTTDNGRGFEHLPFDLDSIVWDENCGRPTKFKANGSTAPVKDKATSEKTKKTVQKP